MRSLSLLALLLFALPGCGGDEFSSTGSGGSGAGGSAPMGTCDDVCTTRSELACAGETRAACNSECTYWKEFIRWCDEPGDAYLTCLAAEPAASFGCNEVEGPLHIRPDVCKAQQQALLGCWYEGPADGIPPEVHDGCETICASSAGVNCENPTPTTCVDDCLAELDPTKSCDGTWAAYVDCAAAEPASSWHCNGAGNAELPGACVEYGLAHLACLTAE